MGASPGPPDPPLIRALLGEAHRFSFFQAVSLLERLRPEAVPVGQTGPPAREAIRFRPEVDLGFPSSSLSAVERIGPAGEEWDGRSETERFRITANFLGLYGVDSPLPNHWSEDVLHEQDRDTTVRDFLDLFHHRVYSLFYRTWTKYRYPVQFRGDGLDAFTQRIYKLLGWVPEEIEKETGIKPVRLLRYAGLFLQRPRSAAGLERLLSDWFGGEATEVVSCRGRWMALSGGDRARLGLGGTTLGGDLVLGDSVWDISGRYGIRLGPVGLERYLRLLPEGDDHRAVGKLTELYVVDRLEAELEIRLRAEEVPRLCLRSENAPRLAWTTWLLSDTPAEASVRFILGGGS